MLVNSGAKNENQLGATADGNPGGNAGERNSPVPSISLPKGGGAIRGIGEKFSANPVTGTGSMTVPIATSPGRAGFNPQLALSYDSGAGNGPFGFGWSLSLPTITRKTDKGLPRYRDADESDVFIFSGAEDLVPELRLDGSRFIDEGTVPGFTIHRYRPRVEGLFARIERWTRQSDGDVHWRSFSTDNILTLYGQNDNSRIADPADPRRIFSWLICETRDDKGNAVHYEYKPEDGAGVNLAQACERNRGGRDDSLRKVNRYLKRIHYGNRVPLLDEAGRRPHFLTQSALQNARWMFEVVFDYGEHRPEDPTPDDRGEWLCRHDPFSSYRAGYEVRAYRSCQRILMFHHFPGERGVEANCLVRSTDFVYRDTRINLDDRQRGHPVASFIAAVTQSGYKRVEAGGYLKKSLPPLEFEYSPAVTGQEVHDVDPGSLENLPSGVDGSVYQWVDLDGEGLSGVLTEQGGGWFYKRNESTLTRDAGTQAYSARFAPVEQIARKPAGGLLTGDRWQFLDLAGDGQVDLVKLDRPLSGFYERTDDQDWEPFRAFRFIPNLAWDDPNLKFIDLTGDGHADVFVTEDEVFTWHPSLAEEGFGPAERVSVGVDEEHGPRVAFADSTQTISLADLSGDGLTDIVRIRNGEVCYWPNLGYGRFGAKVTMDDAPGFDTPDQFDPRRIRLADIDGSGVTDIIYLGRNQTRFWFNQSGNNWGKANELPGFPPVDNIASVVAVDLLGNGTACLVWSSALPGANRASMKYLNLMAAGKPHLMVRTSNNLGAETRVHYAPSTYFYLQDKYAGKPWITKLPFPVHVVERVETYDHISRNRFVTRYAYHHGYFDGGEREFRGFGMVEQWDTEESAALTATGELPVGDNTSAASHVPPVYTKTWFHTGVHLGRDRVSNFFAGLLSINDRGEYYREPAQRDTDVEAGRRFLDDTVLPAELTIEEEREACRALKSQMLRQEIYALDGTGTADYPDGHPYLVTEQNFTIQRVQPRGGNRHGVFFTHAREAVSYHYERNPVDPRISHALTLEADRFGNPLRSLAVAYPRANVPERQPEQNETHLTLTLNRFANRDDEGDWYRVGLPVETRTYEMVKPPTAAQRFTWEELSELVTVVVPLDQHEPLPANTIPYEQWDWRKSWSPQTEPGGLVNGSPVNTRLRLIEHIRTLYRKNDLNGLLPLGTIDSLALTGESYKLALTTGLLAGVYGARVTDAMLSGEGKYVHSEGDSNWWIPQGRLFYSHDAGQPAIQELAESRKHFFLPRRFRDPFGNDTFVSYDDHDLLLLETEDALGNKVTAGERRSQPDGGETIVPRIDYRVLQPGLVTDPNRNRTELAFDTLGMVVATAAKGKGDSVGDTLSGFEPDLTQTQIDEFYDVADPHVPAPSLLKGATTRIIYDLDCFRRTRQAHPAHSTGWLPPYAATLARETHTSDPLPPPGLKIQISFSYSDGFGREIQKKIQAEPGPLIEGGPVVSPRWVGSGWTVFNNKGKPVRQYEPFFSQLPEKRHRFEFGVQVGVSSVLFYDPIERVVATLHPNHTYEKVVFDPWQQTTYDVNDTVAANGTETGDPRSDADIRGYVAEYFKTQPDTWQTWHQERLTGAKGAHEKSAAEKTAKHANTPATAHFDTLGRPFLTLAHNGFEPDGTPVQFSTRILLDIEGNQREIRDAVVQSGDPQGRVVMRYDYDLLGNPIHQASMEAGERWMLGDVTGNLIRAWDSRAHAFRTEYDRLRRPVRSFVSGADPNNPNQELLTECLVYGEQHPENELRNLRGKLYLYLDQAGAVTNEAHDFKGNPLRATRRLAREYKQAVNWNTVNAALPAGATAKLNPAGLEAALAVQLEANTFTSRTSYDALNRPVQLIAPRSDQPGARRNVIQPVYNEANLLERVHVWLDHPTELAGLLDAETVPPSPVGVHNIDYDAKGQRLRIEYKNNATTHYAYDPETFRLIHLYTRRGATFTEDCENPQPPPPTIAAPDVPPPNKPCGLQSLHYTYDPAGNITHIRDDAQQTIYFRNKRVEPSADYTYDAIYRLIEATGREHLGQIGGVPILHSHNDQLRVRIDWSANDGNAMGTYVEQYVYDAVGNFLSMQHRGSDPAHPGWNRNYAYNEASSIESVKQSNRLSSTAVVGNNSVTERYVHDAHGNIIRMPHLANHPDPQAANMHWDHKDQMRRTDLGGGGTAYYVYDAAGQRKRKVWEKTPGLIEERIYIGGFEVFRRRNGAGAVTLERETLHVMDDKHRIALVETRTQGNEPGLPERLIRYQFGNHLGSASLELDHQGQIISYEEYTPYGSTSYQAVRNQTETPKRYRYTGKERDEETGFTYHGARYYAPWLGRWESCDPAGYKDGLNIYQYVSSNPIRLVDVTGMGGTIVEETKITRVRDGKVEVIKDEKKTIAPEVTVVGRTPDQIAGDITEKTGIRAYDLAKALGEEHPGSDTWGELEATLEESGVIPPVEGPSPDEGAPESGPALVGPLSSDYPTVGGVLMSPDTADFFEGLEEKARAQAIWYGLGGSMVATGAARAQMRSIGKAPVMGEQQRGAPVRGGANESQTAPPPGGPQAPGGPPAPPSTSGPPAPTDQVPDVPVGALRRWNITPGPGSRGVTPDIRQEVVDWAERYGTMDGPPTTGSVHAGHQYGGSHVFTPNGQQTRVGAQTARGNLSQSSAEARAAAMRRQYNQANPNAPQLSVRPRGSR